MATATLASFTEQFSVMSLRPRFSLLNSSSTTPGVTIATPSYIGMLLSPPIFLIGVVGNFLAGLVMRRKAFRETTASVYLPLMAVADTILLVTGIPHEWFDWFNVDMNSWVCKWHKAVFYTSGDVGIWTIVLFTFDRFIAVCFPLQKRRFCVRQRAIVAWCVALLCCLGKNMHVFWTRGEEQDTNGEILLHCGFVLNYIDFEYFVRPWIVFALIIVTPFCILLSLNCLIVRSLLSSQRMRAGSVQSNRNMISFRQITFMCLSVSFTFLVCIAPSIVLVIGKPHWKRGKKNLAYDIAKVINNLLVYFNHAVNFFLYCMTGEKFRSELSAMFGRKKKGNGQVSTPNNDKVNVSKPPSLATFEII